MTQCPTCDTTVAPDDAFCERCGSAIGNAPPATATTTPTTPTTPPAASTVVTARSCTSCGGAVLDDGFCSQCGRRALTARDHWEESPVGWLGGVCDKGVVHARNEDAMAIAGLDDGSFGAMVVCDGVTTAPDSDRGSMAAVKAACAALVTTPPPESVAVAGVVSHWSAALVAACADAQAAIVGVAHALGDPDEPPSCTFVAAVVQRGVATVAWCGDSRAYWFGDDGQAELLVVDHSMGTEMMQAGMSREHAESDPSFHTITRWLGADSVDPLPELTSRAVNGPGWLLVCSDGLWNYASSPAALAGVLRELGHHAATPIALARSLVDWANGQGGHDNITAAVARVDRGYAASTEEG